MTESLLETGIEIRSLSFGYTKERLFSNLDLTLRGGNIYGLLGKNGARPHPPPPACPGRTATGGIPSSLSIPHHRLNSCLAIASHPVCLPVPPRRGKNAGVTAA